MKLAPLWIGPLLLPLGCAGIPHRELDGRAVIPESERLVVLDLPGLAVDMQAPDVLAGPRVRSAFVARSVDGGPELERFLVEVWSDDDGDGVRGEAEAWTRVDVCWPRGRDWLAAHVQAWYTDSTPLRFAVEVRDVAGGRHTAAGAFAFGPPSVGTRQ